MCLTASVHEAFFRNAAEQFVARGECLGLFLFSFKRLFLYAFLPMMPVLLFGADIFAFVFGEGWRAAGEIVSVVSILMFFQTISLPLSNTVILRGWLLIDSLWQLMRVISVAVIFYACSAAGLGCQIAIIIYVCVFSGLYLLNSYMQFKAAHG